jgi:hypothetical protein
MTLAPQQSHARNANDHHQKHCAGNDSDYKVNHRIFLLHSVSNASLKSTECPSNGCPNVVKENQYIAAEHE